MQLRPDRKDSAQAPNRTVPATVQPRTHPAPDARHHHLDDRTPTRYAPPRGSDFDVTVWLRLRLPPCRGWGQGCGGRGSN